MNLLSKILIGFLISLLLLINSGISFSHVKCRNGETWVLGSQMPDCEKDQENFICPYSGKVCHKPTKERKERTDKRTKKTYSVECKLIAQTGDNLQSHIVDVQTVPIQISELHVIGVFNFVLDNYTYSHYKANPPPLLSKPDLAFIQVYRI